MAKLYGFSPRAYAKLTPRTTSQLSFSQRINNATGDTSPVLHLSKKMTFKKEFKRQMVPEWIEAYMDYEDLKGILKEIKSSKQAKHQAMHSKSFQHRLSLPRAFSGIHSQHSCHHRQEDVELEEQVIHVDAEQGNSSRELYKTNFLKCHEEGGEAEARLFQKLDEQLNKVNNFYKDQVEAVKEEAAHLNKQLEALIALRIKVKDRDSGIQYMGSTPAETMNNNNRQNNSFDRSEVDPGHHTNENTHYGEKSYDNCNIRDPTEILERVKLDDSLQSPMSTIKNVFRDSKQGDLTFDKEEVKKVEEQLGRVFIDFYHKLLHLEDYSFTNLSAFSKIMKKYEKITSRAASRAYIEVVDNSYLGSSDEVNCLLEKVESIFIRDFSNSKNRKKGMKSLRPKAKKEKHSTTFLTGFFSGCLLALLVATVLRTVSHRLTEKQQGTFYMVNIFPLYSLFGYITLHMLMYATNTYFWKHYRVNYPVIFGFKPGTELGYREVFLLSTGLAVLGLLGFLVNLELEMNQRKRNYKTVNELVPLALVAFTKLTLLVYTCSSLLSLLNSQVSFGACSLHYLLPFQHHIPFKPFLLHPVTFPEFFLADQLTSQFQAFKCLELYICYYGMGEHSRRQNKCQGRGVYNTLYFVVGIIPYWFRLAQCMRQWYDNKDINRAFNGLNYLSTIVAIVIRTTFELKKGKTWMVLALISSAVAMLQNTYWDIVRDWGLLQRHAKDVYLRDKLVLTHKSVYFIAMVLDVLLRLSWMQLVLELNWCSLHKVAITTIISCLEIIRRGIWNFFRLENEH